VVLREGAITWAQIQTALNPPPPDDEPFDATAPEASEASEEAADEVTPAPPGKATTDEPVAAGASQPDGIQLPETPTSAGTDTGDPHER